MKKKLTLVIVAVVLIAAIAVGGSLAYFTDTAAATNTFTVGDVKIAIREVFDPDASKLIPGKDINKDVYVNNTGSEPAYVRVHVAIPKALDDGDPSFAAYNNMLHWNFTNESVAAGQWSWIPTMTDGKGYLGNGAGNWNYYETKVDGIDYAVYVATYRSALASGAETATQALDKVYLDKGADIVENTDGTYTITDKNAKTATVDNANLKILVIAEGCQTEGFTDAYTALNTSFGTPGTYNAFTK